MTDNKQQDTRTRRPDCVTEIRMGNSVLAFPAFQARHDHTAADKMAKVLEAEAAATQKPAI